jgi:hypothetical protein
MTVYDDMQVDLPEATSGKVAVEHFTVDPHSVEFMRTAMRGRGCCPGTYTRLTRNGHLWMSDTTAERMDHLSAAYAIEHYGGRVLIGGLGLGMILRAALLTPTVTHIDVVEIDPDVVALVGPTYLKTAREKGISLTIHTADVLTMKWPIGTHWNVAWFDIWQDLSSVNLDSIAKLRRSYGRRTEWCECWGRKDLVAARRRERSSWW